MHSPPSFSDILYTINIKTPDNSTVLSDVPLPSDGFVIAYTVKDDIEYYYYEAKHEVWTCYSTSVGSVHTNIAFHAPRDELLAQLQSFNHISYMLDKADVPIYEKLPIILKIQQAVVSLANDPSYAAPKIIPILVEIETRICRDISPYMRLSSNDDQEDIDDGITINMSSLSIEENAPNAEPALRFAVEFLKKVKLDSVDGEEGVCAICFEDFLEGVEVIYMPCKHSFHGECITKWLHNNNICPLCRFEIPFDPSE